MTPLSALDTNILGYAEGVNGDSMRETTLSFLRQLPPDSVVLPVNALGELFNILVRKAGRSPAQARSVVQSWANGYRLAGTSAETVLAAADLAEEHQFGIWDALILATAADAGCQILFSEDMQHGFTWRGVTILNPFSPKRHPLLEAWLGSPGRQT